MDFELTADQTALQEGVRSFCQGRFAATELPALADAALADPASVVDRRLWNELAEMGVFSLHLPEEAGGVGLGWAEAVLVMEELGRALVPGPLVWQVLAAKTVDGSATGERVVAGLEVGDRSGLVEHAGCADVLVALDPDGALSELGPPGDGLGAPASPLDPFTPVWSCDGLPSVGSEGSGSNISPGTTTGPPPSAPAGLALVGAALTAALQLGLAQAATERAVAFSKERTQFDRPIGSFQALKHLMADMLVRVEVARAAVYAAGVTLDDPEVGSVERAVAAAKITAGEAACANARTNVQVHGGMGYTWEVDAHLVLKRAYALDPAFGSRECWAEVVAARIEAA